MFKITLSTLLVNMFFCTLLFSQAGKVDSSGMKTLRIDPSSARGAAASQIFDEVRFIPLETTKESLFGSISQLRVTDDQYIVHDWETKSILIFSKTGKYIAKINASKIQKDPNDKNSQNFYGFELVKGDAQPLIQIWAGKNFLYFDMKGTFVRKAPSNKGEEYAGKKVFSDGTVVEQGYVDKKGKDSTFYSIGLVKDKKMVAGFFTYNLDSTKNDENWGGGGVFDYGIPDEFFYLKSYEYNLYKITPTKISLSYHLIFPAVNSLPVDYAYNPKYRGKRSTFFEENRKVFYGMENPYLIGNNLYLKVSSFEFNRADKRAFIYNLKSTQLTSLSDIEPDSLSQFLPINDASSHYDFYSRGFHTYDKGYFYTSYSSLAMFTYKQQNDSKNRSYDALLTEYFKTQNRKGNPVIIQLKPKKN